LPVVDRNFIDQSTKRESKVRARARRAQALIYVLLVGIILGLTGLINRDYIEEKVNWYWTMRPYMVAQVDPICSARTLSGRLSRDRLSGNAPRIVRRWLWFRRASS
jgi:hypothetical protein